MRCPRTAPMAKSKASHMISNDLDQSGADIIGAETHNFKQLRPIWSRYDWCRNKLFLKFLPRIYTFIIESEGHVLS